jgi:hypothetical protein
MDKLPEPVILPTAEQSPESRANEFKEKLLPKLTLSTTDIENPSLCIPTAEMELPSRVKQPTETELPIAASASTDNAPDNRA